LGVGKGDRVLIYMPMVAEAAFAMLACARIGAIHSVVFGGFASVSLATRIDDAKPKLIISADAARAPAGRALQAPLDEAIRLSKAPPDKVLLVDRGLPRWRASGTRRRLPKLRAEHNERRGAVRVGSRARSELHPVYLRHHRQTEGRAARHGRLRGGARLVDEAHLLRQQGETYFATSTSAGRGHSYIIYGPLIAGMATVMYEGTPIRPDGGVWEHLERYKVTTMFSARPPSGC